MMKQLLRLVVILLMFGAGVATGYSLRDWRASQREVKEEAVILLEKIQTVAKLVTVEGYFVEHYTRKEFSKIMGLDLNFLPFIQDAKLRVEAKALVGFDLKKMEFTPIEAEKVLEITKLPEAEVLSIEPKITYEKLYEGYLNQYTKEQRAKLNESALTYMRNTINTNEDLKRRAEAQGYEVLKIIEQIATDAGWTVRYVERGPNIGQEIEADTTRQNQ